MSSYTSSSRWRIIFVSAVVVAAVGQSGRAPVSRPYVTSTERLYRGRIELACGEARRADVLLLGNSRVQLGLLADDMERYLKVPGIAGRQPRIVNLGLFGGTPASSLWLWRQAAPPGARHVAKLLVVGVAPLDFTEKSPGRDYELRYLFDVPDALWLARNERITDAATLLTYRAFPLYARRTTVENVLARRQQPVLGMPGVGAGRWWLPLYYRWYQAYRVDPFETRCIEELLQDAPRRGARVVLVAIPIDIALLRLAAGGPPPPGVGPSGTGTRTVVSKTRTPLALYEAAIRNIVRRTGVPYFDYLTPRDSPRFQFADSAHLSAAGATKFTREFSQRVNAALAAEGKNGRPGPSDERLRKAPSTRP